MGNACSCSSVVPKYASHISALYPDPRSPDEIRTLGGVLNQEDVRHWKLRGSASELVSYCVAFPQKVAPAAALLAKNVRRDLARGRLRHAAVGMLALHALVSGAHSEEMLPLYEASVLNSLILCFEHSNAEIQILAAQLLCTLLAVQSPSALGSTSSPASGPGTGAATKRSYLSHSGSGVDFAKFAVFYPLVLAMATRNPPPRSKIAQLIAAAVDSSNGHGSGGGKGDDKNPASNSGADSDSEKQSSDHRDSTAGGGSAGGSGSSKKRRVKDIAELEHAAAASLAAQNERHAHHAHHHAPAVVPADKDLKESKREEKPSSSSSSEAGNDASSSALKLHISLWRSRYFGLKALDTLLRLNRDWRASLAAMNGGDLIPALLCNFPKSRKALRSVSAELSSGALGSIDEAWKYWSTSADKEKLEAAREKAERDEKQAAKDKEKATKEGSVANKEKMIAAEKARSALEALAAPPATFREELAAKTGITLHTVQLMSYAAFRSLCKVPGIEMHVGTLVANTAKWMDQHQRTTVQTTLSGAVIGTSGTPAAATNANAPVAGAAAEDAKHSHAHSHRKDSDGDARSDDHPPLESLPFGWENLYFAAHLFSDLIAREVALESGSIDQIVGGLLTHLAELEALNASSNIAAVGTLVAQSSRRGSKNEQQRTAESSTPGASPPLASAEQKSDSLPDSTPALASTGSSTGGGKTTLAQDFKQLFEKKKKGAGRVSLFSGRNPRLAQIAIVHVINSVLNQPARQVESDSVGFDAGLVDSETESGGLCLMNYQILLDSFVSLVLSAVRSKDLAAKASASGHADLLLLQSHQPAASNGAGGDHDVLEAERALDANLVHASEFLRLLTTVTPSLLIQRFYSFNDILQSITLVLQLALVRPANRPLKAALSDVAYSMSLGMLRWGSGNGGGGLDDDGSKGSASPLTEKQNENRGKGFGGSKRTRFTEGPARMQFGENPNPASNMTSSGLYESLLRAVLGSIACETDVSARAESYKILQAVLMCMSGFGGAWGSFPSPASAQAAAHLLRHSSAASAAGFAFTNLNSMAMVGLTRGNTSGASIDLGPHASADANGVNQQAHRPSSSLNPNGSSNGETDGEYKHSLAAVGLHRQPTGSLDVPAESAQEEKSVAASDNGLGLESSPSPVHAHTHGARGSSPSLGGATISVSSLDIRALRIPQILASCMDIQSAIAAPSGGGAGASAAGASSARGAGGKHGGAGAEGLFFPAALATTGPMAAVSMQDHKWILSIIFYELTSSFSADSTPTPAVVDPAAAAAGSKAAPEPSAFSLASSIIKAKGRGATSNENIALCFQLLILLLLQKHPDQQQQMQAESSSLSAIQAMLGLQLPLLFNILALLRSTQPEDKFALPLPASLRLHAFTTTYFLFVSKLLLMSSGIESHWMRQASVGLEELLRGVIAARAKNHEGLGSELEPNLMFGLVEVSPAEQPATEMRTHIDLEALASMMAKMLVDPPASDAPSTTRAQQQAQQHQTSSSVQDPSMDEHMDARLSEQRAFLLDSNNFEPFALKYLLPEKSPARFVFRGVGGGGFAAAGNEASERENSVSWAPSIMGGADEPAVAGGGVNEPPTGRVGSFFGNAAGTGEMYGEDGLLASQQGTPRLQAAGGQPLGSPSLLHLPSVTSTGASSAVGGGSALFAVPQSPVAPQSLEEMMAELDQQSFQKLASKCSKTVSDTCKRRAASATTERLQRCSLLPFG